VTDRPPPSLSAPPLVPPAVGHHLAHGGGAAHLDLASLDAPPEFAQAGVAGMLDLVACLEWIRDECRCWLRPCRGRSRFSMNSIHVIEN
jgi:hypothetical protein